MPEELSPMGDINFKAEPKDYTIAEKTAQMSDEERATYLKSITSKSHYQGSGRQESGAEITPEFELDSENAREFAEIEKEIREATAEQNIQRLQNLSEAVIALAHKSDGAREETARWMEATGRRFPGEVRDFHNKQNEQYEKAQESIESAIATANEALDKYGLDIFQTDKIEDKIVAEYPSDESKELYRLVGPLYTKLDRITRLVSEKESSSDLQKYKFVASRFSTLQRNVRARLESEGKIRWSEKI